MDRTDTSPEAQRQQDDASRALGAEGRIALVFELSESVFRMSEDGIRLRHPDYSEDEVRYTAIRLRLGDALFRAAYPHAPVLPS